MAQISRPVLDVDTNGWTPTPSSPATLYDKVDEVVADDADYISSVSAPAGEADLVELKFQAVTDPLTSDDHIVRYRIAKDLAAGEQIDVEVRLMEGAVEIASWTHTNITDTITTYEQTLTSGEADAISDYANLRIVFVPTQS